MPRDSHLSDQQLLLELDQELSAHDARQARAHLGECWKCRARRQELESAISEFVRARERQLDPELPPAAGPRALLRAQLAQRSAQFQARSSWFATGRRPGWLLATAVMALLSLSVVVYRLTAGRSTAGRHPAQHAAIISLPDSRLTPGARVLAGRQAVCTGANTKNKTVPVALQRKVFAAYGISGAEPREYEVDYLITPALGGADDIHNLWPQSHSATVWNAAVKDALEDRLREMVCDGTLDLAEAQQEIAFNWVAAYKKYFHTDRPLAEHTIEKP